MKGWAAQAQPHASLRPTQNLPASAYWHRGQPRRSRSRRHDPQWRHGRGRRLLDIWITTRARRQIGRGHVYTGDVETAAQGRRRRCGTEAAKTGLVAAASNVTGSALRSLRQRSRTGKAAVAAWNRGCDMDAGVVVLQVSREDVAAVVRGGARMRQRWIERRRRRGVDEKP